MMKTILDLFVFLYKKLIYIYEKSFINKIINNAFDYMGRKTNESYIGDKFIKRKDRSSLQKHSLFFKIILSPLKWIKDKIYTLLDKNTNIINDSISLKPYNILIQILLNVNTKFWGIVFISLSMFLTIFYILGRILSYNYFIIENCIILGGIFVFGVILYVTNNSTKNLINGSILTTKIKELVFKFIHNKEEFKEDHDVVIKDINPPVKLSLLIGAILAILCGITSPLVIFIAIIGIIGSIIIIKQTIIGIFLAVGLAPILPTMAILGLVVITVMSFILRCLFDKNLKFKISELGFSIILLVIIFAYSMITSFSVKSDLNVFLLTSIFILFYFVFINMIRTKKQLYGIFSIMIGAAFFVALYGIYQNFTGGASNTWTDQELFGDISGRVTSTLANPNVLGEYLILLIPLSIAMINLKKSIFNKFIYAGIAVTLLVCLIFTYSRGCWLGILLGLIIFFICADRKFISIGIIGLLTLPVILPQNIINRFTSIGNLADSSTSYRMSIWIGTIRMLKDYWFSGIGLGEEVFKSIYSYYSYNGITAPHPHNLFLQLMTQIGIIGLIVFIIIIIKLYRVSIIELLKTKSKEYYFIIISIISGISAFLLQSMFDNTWYNYRIILIFITFLAIEIKAVMLSREERKENEEAVL